MSDFFDKNFWQLIITGLIIMIVSFLFRGKSGESTTVGKGWKVVVIIAWVIFLAGIYMFVNNSSLGISLIILGILLSYISKFFIWWHQR